MLRPRYPVRASYKPKEWRLGKSIWVEALGKETLVFQPDGLLDPTCLIVYVIRLCGGILKELTKLYAYPIVYCFRYHHWLWEGEGGTIHTYHQH